MSPKQREAIAAQCQRMQVAVDRIRAEVTRLASEPDRHVVIDALIALDVAHGTVRNLLG
jgi:hypothetical protein